MSIDARLLELLVCPNDRGEIEYREQENVIVCAKCGYRYPVKDGIPVMLIDEAVKPPAQGGPSGETKGKRR